MDPERCPGACSSVESPNISLPRSRLLLLFRRSSAQAHTWTRSGSVNQTRTHLPGGLIVVAQFSETWEEEPPLTQEPETRACAAADKNMLFFLVGGFYGVRCRLYCRNRGEAEGCDMQQKCRKRILSIYILPYNFLTRLI